MYVERNMSTKISEDIAAIPFMLHKQFVINHEIELKNTMSSTSPKIEKELAEIKRQLKRPIVPIRQYAKTKYAAAYLNVDSSFLTKRMRKIFIEGKHYFKPENESIVRWDLSALDEWMTSEYNDPIDDELVELLARS